LTNFAIPTAAHPRQILIPGVLNSGMHCFGHYEQVAQCVNELQNWSEVREVFFLDRPVPREAIAQERLGFGLKEPPSFGFAGHLSTERLGFG
jgi:hypothetical protein